MTIAEWKARFQRGDVAEPDDIDQMHNHHHLLF